MTNEDERELASELARLQQEHRDLDAAIDALHQSPAPDLLRLQRLKKRKLQLRDRIAFIEDQITPELSRSPSRPCPCAAQRVHLRRVQSRGRNEAAVWSRLAERHEDASGNGHPRSIRAARR